MARATQFLTLWFVLTVVVAAMPSAALAWAPGQPLITPFPRLAMWWPDTRTQGTAELARYDWIVLGPWDDPATVAKIKGLHPDEIVLNATNACEVDSDLSAPATAKANDGLRAVSTRWMLTQVGATLTSPVSAVDTVAHVSATTTGTPTGSSVDLFVPGDTVVIQDELAVVTAVDAGAKTITLRRGVVKAASSHEQGTRVAATISLWPGNFVMDVTSACPRATVDPSVGPESWAQYNARIGGALATTAAWDGLIVDRSGGDESWLVGNSTARTIDPDRSNQVPADYISFDGDWNAGVRGYELLLRGVLGAGKLVMTNRGLNNFDLLNGNNFEGVPNADPRQRPWHQMIVTPEEPRGSYLDWVAKGRQPNLTTIQTYDDEGIPAPTGYGPPANSAVAPGFVPNYRKMRFGLTTALLGDGFFSYEINTNGHGALGLLWFDEYDGAGRGAGWLGLPTAPALRVGDVALSADLLGGAGALDTRQQLASWRFAAEPVASGAFSLDGTTRQGGLGSLHATILPVSGAEPRVSASHRVAVKAGAMYTLSFWARSDATRSVDAWVQHAGAPWTQHVALGSVTVTPLWQHFTLLGPSNSTDAAAEVGFSFGGSPLDVWIDDAQFAQGDPNVWLRSFANGVSVVNATGVPVTVQLGGLYRRLLGVQTQSTNSGRLAASLAVPAHDGIVLAKPDMAALGRSIESARLTANTAGRQARAAAKTYAKAATHGGRSARKRAARAKVAWTQCVSGASRLVNALVLAQRSISSPAALVGRLNAAETYAASLATLERTALARGNCKSGRASRNAAAAARNAVGRAAVAPR